MTPDHITFLKGFDSYQEAFNHWNQYGYKEKYSIASVLLENKPTIYFVMPTIAANTANKFDERAHGIGE